MWQGRLVASATESKALFTMSFIIITLFKKINPTQLELHRAIISCGHMVRPTGGWKLSPRAITPLLGVYGSQCQEILIKKGCLNEKKHSNDTRRSKCN